MIRRLYLACDGSLNGDWLSRYAIRIAARAGGGRLVLPHVRDGSAGTGPAERKIDAIAAECRHHGVEPEARILKLAGGVVHTLAGAIPNDPLSCCICGARIAPRGKGFLAGTVSEKLMRIGLFDVLSFRVVNPGHLGHASNLLFPMAGHPRGFSDALPFLEMLAADVRRLHVLRVVTSPRAGLPGHRGTVSRAARERASACGASILGEIEAPPASQSWHIDGHVVPARDWPAEIAVQAGKLHAGLILLGATGTGLLSRLVHGNRIEEVLRRAPCDVAIYKKS